MDHKSDGDQSRLFRRCQNDPRFPFSSRSRHQSSSSSREPLRLFSCGACFQKLISSVFLPAIFFFAARARPQLDVSSASSTLPELFSGLGALPFYSRSATFGSDSHSSTSLLYQFIDLLSTTMSVSQPQSEQFGFQAEISQLLDLIISEYLLAVTGIAHPTHVPFARHLLLEQGNFPPRTYFQLLVSVLFFPSRGLPPVLC
jgi:hypothetical protein